MPRITLFPHGINAAQTGAGNPNPPPRGDCRGWTTNTALRNERFLMSVKLSELRGDCYTFTLTLRDLPRSADGWDRVKRSLFKRWRRRGMVRLHYVTEWQRRGAPHLHGVVFFPRMECWRAQDRAFDLRTDWLQVAAEFHPCANAQKVRHEQDLSVGWFVYLSKHASRGVAHYQRERANLPPGWKKTGRMWGVQGEWPTSRQEYEVSRQVFFRFRRFCLAYLRAKARRDHRRALVWGDYEKARSAEKRERYLRRILVTGDRKRSEVRAVAEWMDPKIRDRLILAALEAAPARAEPAPYLEPRRQLRGAVAAPEGVAGVAGGNR